MKKILVSTLVIFLLSAASLVNALPKSLQELERLPEPKLHLPKLQRATLGSGMKLILLPSGELPVVQGVIYIRTGSIYEPADQLGVATITGDLIRSGGTKHLSPKAFDEALAKLGAEVSSKMAREFGVVSFQCLAEDLPKVLELIFQMLREPAFEESKFQLAKLQLIESIKRQNDNPSSIAIREFAKRIYGPDSVWARTPTLASVEKLTRQEVKDFYQRFYHPNRLLWAVSGDFKAGAFKKQLKQLSLGWPKATKPLPKVTPLQKTWEAGVYLAPKSTDQATLLLGHFGERRFNPDKFALLVLNDILGGSTLNSKLGERIRSALGLAYGVYSRFGLESDYGLFYIFAQTKATSTQQLLQESKRIFQEVVQGKISEVELAEHKRSILQSLYAQYEPPFRYVQEEGRLAYLGYPPHYLSYFAAQIAKVDLADLKRVAKKYLRPNALTILVVGDPKKLPPMPKAKVLSLDIL